jgi:pimeloyl-ACP methyl ester carboxylesterase
MLTTLLLALPAAALGAAFVGSRVLARRYEQRYPPIGTVRRIAGRRVHLIDTGPANAGADVATRPPIVFIHGASGNLRDPYLAFGAALRGQARLVFIDRPGHGYTERKAGDADPAAQARLIADVLTELGIERAVVVGISLGGSVAAAFGVRHPERTAGLVFLAPATHPWPGGVDWHYDVAALPVIGPLFCATIAPIAASMVGRKAAQAAFAPNPTPANYYDAQAVPLLFRAASFRANGLDVANLKAHVTALSPRYGDIDAPTVIITGDQDPVVYPSIHSHGLARDIAGARLIELPGIGHMPHHVETRTCVDAILMVADAVRAGVPASSTSHGKEPQTT